MRFIDLDEITTDQYLFIKRFDSKYSKFFKDYSKYTDMQVLQMILTVSKLDFTFNEWNPSQTKYLKFYGFDEPAKFEHLEDVASFISTCIIYFKFTSIL